MSASIRVAYIVEEYKRKVHEELGVVIKIQSQVKAIRKAGFEADILTPTSRGRLAMVLISRIPFLPDGNQWDTLSIDKYDALYIRRPNYCSRDFIRWLEKVKSIKPSMIVLLEVPTYPYDREDKIPHRYPLHIKDLLHRKDLYRFVDKAIDLDNNDVILGIPTIKIQNGIDLDKTCKRIPRTAKQDTDDIALLFVARFNFWHGADRLLRGISRDIRKNGKRRVKLHLVGGGPAISSLKKSVEDLQIADDVVFHGQLAPDDYDYLYDVCDMAIECLGCHRKDIQISSSLKSREYLAKGIPFIYSGEIDVFNDHPVDFCLCMPADESPIDIQRVVGFRNLLYKNESPKDLTSRIRAYAEKYVSMDTAMEPVINYLKEAYSG